MRVRAIIFLVALFVPFAASRARGSDEPLYVIHVNHTVKSERQTGASWAEAYASLTAGLAKAAVLAQQQVVEVRVAAGTYRGVPGSAPGSSAFVMGANIRLIGGWCPACDVGATCPASHETILNGDLLGNDDPAVAATLTDNQRCLEVVNGNSCTAIENVTLSRGRTFSLVQQPSGGGLKVIGGECRVRSVRITENYATWGGGIAVEEGALDIDDSVIIANWAFYNGGGVLLRNASMTMADSVVSGNVTEWGGGGGLATHENANSTIVDSIISYNRASAGGGVMYVLELDDSESCIHEISRSRLIGNESGGVGSAIFTSDDGSPAKRKLILDACEVLFNRSFAGRAAIYVRSFDVDLVGSTVAANMAHERTGGIYVLRADLGDGVVISSSIVHGNPGAPGAAGVEVFVPSSKLHLEHSNVEGFETLKPEWIGPGMIDADPGFVNLSGPDGLPGTDDDSAELAAGSPCIDTGDPGVEILDWTLGHWPGWTDGNLDGTIVRDMGAREFSPLALRVIGAEATADCSPTLEILSSGGTPFLVMLIAGRAIGVSYIHPLGVLLVDQSAGLHRWFVGTTPLTLELPASCGGLSDPGVWVQALGFTPALPGNGVFSNVVRVAL